MSKSLLFIKRNIVLLPLLVVSFAAPLTTMPVYAQSKTDVCTGLGGCDPASQGKIQGVVSAALSVFSIVIGIAAVIMIMLGGFRYITAGGDSSKIASAQNTILWAIVGLVVAGMSQVIVRFVLDRI